MNSPLVKPNLTQEKLWNANNRLKVAPNEDESHCEQVLTLRKNVLFAYAHRQGGLDQLRCRVRACGHPMGTRVVQSRTGVSRWASTSMSEYAVWHLRGRTPAFWRARYSWAANRHFDRMLKKPINDLISPTGSTNRKFSEISGSFEDPCRSVSTH